MFKPLLAPRQPSGMETEEYLKKYIKYPLLASPKYDGIRGYTMNDMRVYSRTGKFLPSIQVQANFSGIHWLDGEFIEGNPQDFGVYNRTQSHIMSKCKPGKISYYLIDYIKPDVVDLPFYRRVECLEKMRLVLPEGFKLVTQVNIENLYELLAYEEFCLNEGFEGIMLRDPIAPYKYGRGTLNQGIIFKVKRFEDVEGVVVGFEEGKINNNTQERDELGYAKRSTKKEGIVGAKTLGKFIVFFEDQYITVAPGCFNHDDRKLIWDNQEQFEGLLLKFKVFRHGSKDKPRHPVALGWRDKIDM